MNKRKSENNFNNQNKKINNEMIYIKHEINSIDDLIYLGKQYIPGNLYNINLKKLFKLIPVLTKLQNIIGMDNIKKNHEWIYTQFLSIILGLGVVLFISYITGSVPTHAKIYMKK
jgi:hypothetical protein